MYAQAFSFTVNLLGWKPPASLLMACYVTISVVFIIFMIAWILPSSLKEMTIWSYIKIIFGLLQDRAEI